MSEGLKHDRDREATASIRGYVYQAYQSILAWMRLGESEVLFLEGAEDFDVHEGDKVEATQVKDTASILAITLRSVDAFKAINNLWKHQKANPDKKIRIRFLTTSIVGQEKGISFPIVGTGIAYWELAARDDHIPVGPLKDFLLQLDLQDDLKNFLMVSNDRVIREELVQSIHWDTGNKPKDVLITEIRDLLVLHGDKRGVDTRHSEQALDSLLGRIADLLSSADNRRLIYADFLRAFEEATMELIPRGEAATLRRAIGQTLPLNFSLTSDTTASSITLLKILDAPLPLVSGAVHRHSLVNELSDVVRRHGAAIVRGSTGVGKTSLARLVTDKIGGTWVWAGFRGHNGNQIARDFSQALSELRALPSPLRIVLDDLDLEIVSQFERELLLFVFSVINNRGFILVTGPNPCPSILLQKLWLPEECNQSIPYLNENDIRDLLINNGAPDVQELVQWSRFIFLTTKGHPQLAHARVRNLQAQSWPRVQELGFFQAVDLEQERDLARRRLMEEIPSENARSLAYRLSFLTGQFPRETAITLAGLSPVISLPGEPFETLIGPWIEELADNKYRVSPLLQNAGDKVLSTTEIQPVHEAIALSIVRQRTLSPYDFGTALIHALMAKSGQALGILAAGTIRAQSPNVWQALAGAVFWFPSVANQPGQRICETNPYIEVLLRVIQFEIAVAGKRLAEALAIIERTDEVISGLGRDKVAIHNANFAYSTFVKSVEVPIRPSQWIYMLSRLIELREADQDLGELWRNFEAAQQPGKPLAGLSTAQVLFAIRASYITGLQDLDRLLDALEDVDTSIRIHLLVAFTDDDYDLADLLVGNAWWRDASKNTLEVDRGILILRKAVDFGRKWNVLKLIRAAYVAMAVLHDEYGQDSESALRVLQEATNDLDSEDPRLLNQRAKVHYTLKQYDRSLDFFRMALADSRLPAIERTFSYRLAGICAGRSADWKAAESFFKSGAASAKLTKVQDTMAVGLMADAAFARWKQNERREALTLYTEVLKELENVPIDENLANRHLHATVRHCLGWIDTTGRLDQDPLAEPPPGMCSNPDPHAGFKELRIIPMAGIWGLLGNIDTRFRTGLGLMELAENKYGTELPILIRLHDRFAKYEALWEGDDFTTAVPKILGMIEASNYHRQIQGADVDLFNQAGELPRLSGDYWADSANRATVLFNLLSLAVLITSKNRDSQLPLEAWQENLRDLGMLGSDVNNFFYLLVGLPPTGKDLFDQATSALYKLRETLLVPKDLFHCHFRLLNFLASGEWGMFVKDAFAQIVARQWAIVAETQRFALQSPSLYAPLLRERCEQSALSGYAKAAAILETAADAVGASLHESGKHFLTRLNQGEFPIRNIESK